VDRSILGPAEFVDANVIGTSTLLDACRKELAVHPRDFRFVHVSTDEVYGDLGPSDPPFTEESPLRPNNPYAASKAAADHIVWSYVRTFGLPAIITRCSNNYGPYQFPEKLIPLAITRASRNESIPVYGDGRSVRDWLHVDDHCDALSAIVEHGTIGSTYNIGGETEVETLEIVRSILSLLGKPDRLIEFVRDRPGNDKRYAMDIRKIRRDLHWSPGRPISNGLMDTVEWYMNNIAWWEDVLSEAYRAANDLYMNVTA
jgi:dTDP-glucose 4,6-dehydratase